MSERKLFPDRFPVVSPGTEGRVRKYRKTRDPGKSSCPQISQIIATAQIYLNMPEVLSPRRLRIEASMPPQ